MMQVLGTTVNSLRQVTTRLRPPILDDLGLADAVRWQLDAFARSTDIAVDSNISVGTMDMDKHVATDVFRILQESLTNVARHASASKVQVSLTVADGSLLLEVRDDGCGMDLEGGIPRFSHGLVGIRERVLALGGSVDMSSTPRNGFAVRVQIPLVKPELPGDQK
jgi:signal transduction histidine kinase